MSWYLFIKQNQVRLRICNLFYVDTVFTRRFIEGRVYVGNLHWL